MFTEEIMNDLFDILEGCKNITQLKEYHPEGDVFVHSIQCLYYSFRETIDTDLIIAAGWHDIGKKIMSNGHDKEAVEILKPLVSTKTLWLIENHMRIWYFILGEMNKLSKVKELINHPWIPELIHLARLDKKARKVSYKPPYSREDVIKRLNKCIEERFKLNLERSNNEHNS